MTAAPLSRGRAYLDDELMANKAFALINRLGNAFPRAVPGINRLSARSLSSRTYTDTSHKVLVSERKVRFREMEYAVPRAAGMDALVEARRVLDRGGWPISFPVEVRFARAEDPWLAMAHGRDTVFLSFHVNARTDHTAPFACGRGGDARPRGPPALGQAAHPPPRRPGEALPTVGEFRAVRDTVDPDRLFANDYLDRVLGR